MPATMDDLQELYQELILDHNRNPHNHRSLDSNHKAEGCNPLCGDRVTVFLDIQDGVLTDVCFEGTGCAISTASASMMTDYLKGKTKEEALALFQHFHDMATGNEFDEQELGKLVVFSGVCKFPARVKCATLVWHAVKAAIERKIPLDGGNDLTTD